MHDFDQSMGPYPVKTWPLWHSLVSTITSATLERCVPVSGVVTSTAAALVAADRAASDSAAAALPIGAPAAPLSSESTAKSGSGSSSAGGGGRTAGSGSSAGGGGFFFSPIRGVGAGAAGVHVTAYAMDTSDALLYVIGKYVRAVGEGRG